MPKNDEGFQKELGIPKAYNVTPITQDYPRIVSEVVKEKGIDKTISPVAQGTRDTGGYDEKIGDYENLHEQYVKPNQIEVSPKSFKQ